MTEAIIQSKRSTTVERELKWLSDTHLIISTPANDPTTSAAIDTFEIY